jgi:hypothetical protein
LFDLFFLRWLLAWLFGGSLLVACLLFAWLIGSILAYLHAVQFLFAFSWLVASFVGWWEFAWLFVSGRLVVLPLLKNNYYQITAS